MEVVDPFAFITTECLIPATQHQLLSTTSFYRQDDFSPAADDYGDDDTWPVSSDNDNGDGVPLPDDNNVEITFCSVPSTPDNQDDVVPSHSDEFEANTTTQLNGVVYGSFDELEGNATAKFDDTVSPNSDELEGICAGREESTITPRFSDLNDVVCGSTDELGFVTPLPSAKNTTSDLNDVVCDDSDELGFSVGTKRAREESSVTPPTTVKKKLRFCDDAENTTSVANDDVSENNDGFGLNCCEGIQNDVAREGSGDLGVRFCDDGDKIAAENSEEIVNDVVDKDSDELGFCTEERRASDKIAVENTEEMVNDVVGEDSDELGLCAEERRAKENSLTPPAENNKEVTDDVVSENSIDLGFKRDINTTNEEVVSPTTAEIVENTKTVQNDIVSDKFVDLGERNLTNEEFTMISPSTTKELRSPELDGAEMEVEIENTAKIDCDTEEVTVVDDCKGKELDTEEVKEDDVISDNTEEIDTSDNEGGGNDNRDGDTEEVAEEEELNNSTLNRDSEAEKCGNHVNCLMEVMKTFAERSRKEKEGGEVDFLETAKRRGYTFPKPRWMSS